jgi:hypothetical protein
MKAAVAQPHELNGACQGKDLMIFVEPMALPGASGELVQDSSQLEKQQQQGETTSITNGHAMEVERESSADDFVPDKLEPVRSGKSILKSGPSQPRLGAPVPMQRAVR